MRYGYKRRGIAVQVVGFRGWRVWLPEVGLEALFGGGVLSFRGG